MNNFPYKWQLKNGYPAERIERHNFKVFGTFICGGGSTMGYKLAGFNHIGGVEIDPQIAKVYKENHKPKHLYNEDIRIFNQREDLPKELFELDILDGSPPCSTFSVSGLREKVWGKEKQFREGQSKQTLDDLVFTYCDTIIKLKPKVFILENVKGIILGNAKAYTKEIVSKMSDANYVTQVFLLNSASMGIPQKRERVFFIGFKRELNFPKLNLSFKEKPILFKEICDFTDKQKNVSELYDKYWDMAKPGCAVGKFKTIKKENMNDVAYTILASNSNYHPLYKRELNSKEICQIGTFPLDFNFLDVSPNYLVGMSVPPVMTAQIANQIYLQWLREQ